MLQFVGHFSRELAVKECKSIPVVVLVCTNVHVGSRVIGRALCNIRVMQVCKCAVHLPFVGNTVENNY